MSPWHYKRIKIEVVREPWQAEAGNWVFFFIDVRNSDKNSPFRRTKYACQTLGM